jgi:hypothetical protein
LTPRIRHNVVGLLLAVFMIWPLVQQQLVLRYRVSPWKLAGWAMYTTVMPRGNMALTGIDASGRRVPLDPRSSADLLTTRSDFMSVRLMLGLFADPLPVARAMAGAHPAYQKWEITVNEVGLSRRGWLETIHQTVYSFKMTSTGVEQANVSYPAPPLTRKRAEG